MGVAGSCDQQHRLLACKAGNQIADDSCSICFPAPPTSYIQSRSPAHGMAPLTFQLGLPFSVKPFRKHPHRHALECISLVTVNVDRLTRLTATKSLHKRLCNAKEMWHLSGGPYFLSVPSGSRVHLSGAWASSFSPEVSLMSLE